MEVNKTIIKKVATEDLGKIFEMSICMLYNINYDGKYKYSIEEAQTMKDKIYKLKEVFPHNIRHIAKNGSKYDFVSEEDETLHLSAKTSKKDGKVCPQVIGQPSKKKFCDFFGLDANYDLCQIKEYIEGNVHAMLDTYMSNTFDCPMVYYNQYKKLLLFIKLLEPIDWTTCDITFSHNMKNKKWNESSSIIVNGTSETSASTIGEFQVHSHRDCIKFRWAFEKLLDNFKHHFDVIDLTA